MAFLLLVGAVAVAERGQMWSWLCKAHGALTDCPHVSFCNRESEWKLWQWGASRREAGLVAALCLWGPGRSGAARISG